MPICKQYPWSHVGIIIAIFVICIGDMIFVWNAIEQELGDGSSQQQIDNGNYNMQNKVQVHHPHTSNYTVHPEKQYAYDILQSAGVSVTPDVIASLPRWSDVVSQYGPSPLIQEDWAESCQRFRELIPKEERYAGVAGLFNTGTHLIGSLMLHNCVIDGKRKGTGMRNQVPWGKHNPPTTHRYKNTAKVGGNINQTVVFPLVIIKDPYHWTVSACRHKYMTNWEHDEDNCPNIVNWKSGKPTRVSVKYALGRVSYPTLIDQWNDWYNDYDQQSTFPFAILRFEDILFHAEEVVNRLCTCVEGRRRRGGFQYPEDSAKNAFGHEGSSGLVSALLRYGDPSKRLEGWTKEDWEYARDTLDEGLMNKYGYSQPAWP